MGTTQTQLPPPPVRDTTLSRSEQLYFALLQYLLPLREVDTSNGDYSEDAPSPGMSGETGQTNQNQEITYIKVSSDGHTFTLNNVVGGPYTLTAKGDVIRIKSDAVEWWKII